MDTQRMNAVLTTVRSPMCHQRPLRSSQQTTDQYCGHILPICNLRQFALIARAHSLHSSGLGRWFGLVGSGFGQVF